MKHTFSIPIMCKYIKNERMAEVFFIFYFVGMGFAIQEKVFLVLGGYSVTATVLTNMEMTVAK